MDGAPDDRRLFDQAGLVPAPRSALYQLLAIRKEEAPLFERAECVMFLSDYIRYRLTGVRACDYSLAQASGLTLAGRREWNTSLFDDVGMENPFPGFASQDAVLGALSEDVVKAVGYEADVISTPANPIELAAYVLRPHMAITSWLGGRIALFNEGNPRNRVNAVPNNGDTQLLPDIADEIKADQDLDDGAGKNPSVEVGERNVIAGAGVVALGILLLKNNM